MLATSGVACFKMCLVIVFITVKPQFVGHTTRYQGGRGGGGRGFSLGVRLVRSLHRDLELLVRYTVQCFCWCKKRIVEDILSIDCCVSE